MRQLRPPPHPPTLPTMRMAKPITPTTNDQCDDHASPAGNPPPAHAAHNAPHTSPPNAHANAHHDPTTPAPTKHDHANSDNNGQQTPPPNAGSAGDTRNRATRGLLTTFTLVIPSRLWHQPTGHVTVREATDDGLYIQNV
jgi:hypothetical protein